MLNPYFSHRAEGKAWDFFTPLSYRGYSSAKIDARGARVLSSRGHLARLGGATTARAGECFERHMPTAFVVLFVHGSIREQAQ
jgi:hypothetical protein